MRTLLLLLFFPLLLNAQVSLRLVRPVAPVQGMKSMKVTTFCAEFKKKNSFCDTAFKELYSYYTDGYLVTKTYASVLDHSTYTSLDKYHYGMECWWTRTRYENNRLWDSTYYVDCEPNPFMSRYIYSEHGLHEYYIYRGDSIYNTIVDRPDTIRRAWAEKIAGRDPEWDYAHAGKFDRKETVRTGNVDSVRYFNESGKCIFMIVHYYDKANHPTRVEYYNYKVKKFIVLSMRYNDRLETAEYVVKSRRHKPSYTIDREYNEYGLLKKETYQWQRKGRTTIIKDYAYEFY